MFLFLFDLLSPNLIEMAIDRINSEKIENRVA